MNLIKKIHKSDQTIYYQWKYYTPTPLPPQKKKKFKLLVIKKNNQSFRNLPKNIKNNLNIIWLSQILSFKNCFLIWMQQTNFPKNYMQ